MRPGTTDVNDLRTGRIARQRACLHDPAEPRSAERVHRTFGRRPAERHQRPRVLLVIDHVDLRRAIRQLLELDGLLVVGEASDGSGAMAAVAAADVALVDLHTAGTTGAQIIRQLRTADPTIEIVAHTASCTDGRDAPACTSGAFTAVTKGRDPSVLVDALRAAWEHGRSPHIATSA